MIVKLLNMTSIVTEQLTPIKNQLSNQTSRIYDSEVIDFKDMSLPGREKE